MDGWMDGQMDKRKRRNKEMKRYSPASKSGFSEWWNSDNLLIPSFCSLTFLIFLQ